MIGPSCLYHSNESRRKKRLGFYKPRIIHEKSSEFNLRGSDLPLVWDGLLAKRECLAEMALGF